MSDTVNYKLIVLVNKPRGISSNAALNQIKAVIRKRLNCSSKGLPKIGHAGTLDPLATGLLVVGITKDGTRQLNTFINDDKVYECEVDLLKASETGDLESFTQMSVLEDFESDQIPTLEEVEKLIKDNFTGEVTQTPPIYSALKIGGKKACDLARAGKHVEIKSRVITLHKIVITSYKFPVLGLRVFCSKGTYIRTVGSDIGKALGLHGTLLSLRRIQSGAFRLDDAYELSNLAFEDLTQ
jgi:tRNA pseudouridine55 synthase